MTQAQTLQAPALAALSGIRHGFFTREGGVSEGIYASLNGGVGSKDTRTHVDENRARMAKALGVAPGRLLSCYQIHSPKVVVATEPWSHEDRPHADAMVTREPGLAIGVSTADCGPVLFADPQAKVIGAAHAGWRGALGGVLEATVIEMERLGASRSRIVAAAGPMIHQPNYEVGTELVEKFVADNADNARFFAPGKPGHAMFDLPGYVVAGLKALRLAAVDNLALCTYADPARFYSYRRTTHRAEPDYGRHVNAIALTG